MKKRIFFSIFLTSAAVLLLSAVFSVLRLHEQLTADTRRELSASTAILGHALNSHPDMLSALASDSPNRLTLIAPDGTVLFDSEAPADTMANHGDRIEVQQALQQGNGYSTRLSDTLNRQGHYFAFRLNNGNVLRMAAMLKSPYGAALQNLPGLLVLLMATLAAAWLAAEILTRCIMRPINSINLDDPLSNDVYDELSPLLTRIYSQNKRIAEQLEQLAVRQRQLAAITGNMTEGLIAIGTDQRVLFANRSAEALFTLPVLQGKHFLELSRDPDWHNVVRSALDGNASETRLHTNGRCFQLTATPAKGGDSAPAAITFAIDITEKESAENMRREFSANVSHELKTPLTSIMGYAEILENGLVRPEDVQNFAGRIHAESKRLLEMIRNILTLSRLDEQKLHDTFEPVNLLEVCEDVKKALEDKASKRHVTLDLSGDPVSVPGIRSSLFEMLFNICDNAIIYNKPEGSVHINVTSRQPAVTITDTGIGIPEKHQNRIFERFYRADKSRTRPSTGDICDGSGLGLAIAKHVAMLHGAIINLTSKEGEGTTVCISWAKQK